MLGRILVVLSLLTLLTVSACGGRQQGTDESLVEKVCEHAMRVAAREQIGDFTMEQCHTEVRKRAEKLRSGFRGWANCLLNMNSIEEAKLNCRESDFMNPS